MLDSSQSTTTKLSSIHHAWDGGVATAAAIMWIPNPPNRCEATSIYFISFCYQLLSYVSPTLWLHRLVGIIEWIFWLFLHGGRLQKRLRYSPSHRCHEHKEVTDDRLDLKPNLFWLPRSKYRAIPESVDRKEIWQRQDIWGQHKEFTILVFQKIPNDPHMMKKKQRRNGLL